MNDSWEAFAAALKEESQALSRLQDAALVLTKALVRNAPNEILAAERALDAARRAFQELSSKRRGMQARGFGNMTLRQVCAYAPRRLAPVLGQRLSELSTYAVGTKISSGNNKALISSGLARLMRVMTTLQKAANPGPGTYKRRGFIPPPTNSVLVSSRA